MSYKPSVLERLQLDIGARIASAPPFANVPVNIIRPRTQAQALLIQTEIDRALEGITQINGVGGVTVLVNMPTGDVPSQETPGPRLSTIILVRVIENPLVNMGANGTGVSAEDYLLDILNLLHQWYCQDIGSSLIADRNAFDPVTAFLEKGQIAYDIRFRIPMGLSGPIKVPRPVITGNAFSGAIISANPGLTIFYSLDGSYPSAQNGSLSLNAPILDDNLNPILADNGMQLFTDSGAIPVTSGTHVRAVAINPAAPTTTQASDLAAYDIP